MSSHIPARTDRRVRERARNCCEYCRLPQQWQEATFHFDHVKPRSAGGETTLGNLALACVSCSLRKAARVHVKLAGTGRWVSLYNPRNEAWEDHFKVGSSFRLVGVTDTGRATIRAPGMNRVAIVAIRRGLSAIQHTP